MTYRASLGTRGELRRIAAEAENVTIDRVRPWIRKVQHCRLAPHVIVPQWTRLEHPVKPKPPPPLVSKACIVASELIEEILESATAKKFRRGRGRRGRPRKRVEGSANPDLGTAEIAERAVGVATANGGSTSAVRGTVVENVKEAQQAGPPANQKGEKDAEKTERSIVKDDEEPNSKNDRDQDMEKAQSGAKESLSVDAPSVTREGLSVDAPSVTRERLGNTDLRTPIENEPVTGQDAGIPMVPGVGETTSAEGDNNKDVEMAEASPASKETPS